VETLLHVLPWVLEAAAVGALAFFTLGIVCTRKHLRTAKEPAAGDLPGLSLLKPVKGTEESLEENLRSVYAQRYPGPVEVIFASTDPRDPALDVARRLAAEHPDVPTRFVTSDEGFGRNPKVANLAGALAAAQYDLVLQSDANVRLRPTFAHGVVSELLEEDASLLTSIVVGVGERSIGAALENLQLTCFIAPAMTSALHLAGIHCVVGKSMLLRKSELAEVGGLERVRDILAEDFVLGREYQRLGKKVVLSARTAENVNEDIPVERFLARHSRWLKMRAVIHVGGFVGDFCANPVTFATLAVIASGFAPWSLAAWPAIALGKLLCDAKLLGMLRAPMKLRYLLLAPVKDLLMGGVWAYSMFSRSVEWRGVRLRIGKDSRLRPNDGALPVRVLRRVLSPFRA
jgi:ceramide glucosyltransferase